MSDVLRVAKKWDVQWQKISEFPFHLKIEEFHDVLDALDIGYSNDVWDTDFECSKFEWEDGMKKLKSLYLLPEKEKELIQQALNGVNLSPEDMYRALEQCYNASYPYDDFIHISFF